MRTSLTHMTLGAALLGLSVPAHAQDFPSQPVRIVVPFPPGGVADVIARSVTQKVAAQMQAAIVVDNRGGADGMIGAEFVAKSKPDGYTLLLANLPVMVINALQYSNPAYSASQFTSIIMLADQPYVVAVHPSVPARTLAELIQIGKRYPDRLTFGTASSSVYLAGELLQNLGGFKMTRIPYKGGAPALNDLLGGHTNLVITAVVSAAPHIKTGRLRGLAVTASKRSPILPEIPTAAEAGTKGFEITSWQGIVGPAGLPPALVDRFNAEFNQALKSPDVIALLNSQGVSIVGGTPAQFSRFIAEETKLWGGIAKSANLVKQTL